MTFEPNDIRNSLALMQTAVDMALFYRKRDYSILGNIKGFVRGHSLDNMTRLQHHAELIYAESYLLKAILTIINDESLLSFVREGINVRSSYITYKQCYKWLLKAAAAEETSGPANTTTTTNQKSSTGRKKKTTAAQSTAEVPEFPSKAVIDEHFISGVCFGIGTFNVMLSMLPERVIKVFEVIGFSGARKFGLKMLQHPQIQGGLRRFMCDFTLLSYHIIGAMHIPYLNNDHVLAERLLREGLDKHPNGALYLFFAARLEFAKSNIPDAITYYQRSIAAQKDWEQLHHICYWDMAQCYGLQLRFREASECVDRLVKDSKWSKAVYYYLRAAFQYTAKETGEMGMDMEAVRDSMKSITGRLQRIAGKRIPMEKFVARKSRKFEMQGNRLLFPGMEMMMIRNSFAFMESKTLLKTLDLVQEKINLLEDCHEKDQSENHYDDLCLVYLLKGILLRESKQPVESLDAFLQLLSMEKNIRLDQYMAPYGRYELAKLYLSMNPPMVAEARAELETIKREYKKYSLENQVHFRVHNAMRRVAELEQGGELL